MLLTGEQGSTKSSFARFLRSLIDPLMAPLRSLPFKEHDLIISANNSAVLAYDNISYLKRHTADALCRVATGSGHAARKLYTDSGEVNLSVSRPVILNGIELHNHFHDLMARCISIDLPRMRKRSGRTEKQLWKRFNKRHPKLLGALLDAVSAALKNYKRTKLKGSPRMADFVKWVVAAEGALPWKKGAFLKYYEVNLLKTEQMTLEADPVAVAIQSLMDDYDRRNGTASKLLEELEGDPQQGSGYVPASTIKSRSWPKSANLLSARNKRAAPLLKEQGIKFKRERESKRRHITLKKVKRKKSRNK